MENSSLVLDARTELALETARRNQIANTRASEVELTHYGRIQVRDLEAKYGDRVTARGPATPYYNCHGLVFAARRTAIHEIPTVKLILKDDGYQEVPKSQVLSGDVVIYFDDEGEPIHSGVVLDPPTRESYWIAIIYSKWGDAGEYIHRTNQGPYCPDGVRYQYYRMQP